MKTHTANTFGQGRKSSPHSPIGIAQFRLVVWVSMLCLLFGVSCKSKKEPADRVTAQQEFYTCAMHPQIKEAQPGNCPICGMKLIPVPKSAMRNSMEIRLDREQMELGNIRVSPAREAATQDRNILTGILNFNQDKLSVLSARVAGRIDKLYFKTIGAYVHKGDPVYAIYSESLNNARKEYLTALAQEKMPGNTLTGNQELVESARQKLELWGLSSTDLDALAKTKSISELTTFYSTSEGYLISLGTREGDYVAEGGMVLQLADLSTLWAEAQVYTSQLAAINSATKISVRIPDLNNLTLPGKIDFVNPEVDPDKRIGLIRINIPNFKQELHPGMPVYILVEYGKTEGLTVPAGAVLSDGTGSTVWVETAPGVFEIRMVQTGASDGKLVAITSGLEPGDQVVTSGAYLVNSEYIFENGNDPMAGMDMGGK